MPSIYGYGRVSTDHQGQSLPVQRQIVEAHIAAKRYVEQGYEYKGFFEESASAVKLMFSQRKVGAWLVSQLQPGDIVISSVYDRMVRNIRDLLDLQPIFAERQAKFLCLDLPIDTTTAMGEAMLQMLAVFKQLEVRELSRRCNEGLARRRELVGISRGKCIGWRCKNNIIEPDEDGRKVGEFMLAVIVNNPELPHRDAASAKAKESPYFRQLTESRYSPYRNAATQVRHAAYAAVGWPLMSKDEVNAVYYHRVSPNQDATKTVGAVRIMHSLISSGCWPWDHPGEELTKQRLQGFRRYRRGRRLAQKHNLPLAEVNVADSTTSPPRSS